MTDDGISKVSAVGAGRNAIPLPLPEEIPDQQRVLSQEELARWWHETDAPTDVKDAVSVLLRHHVRGAQAVELLYRQSAAIWAQEDALKAKTTLYVRCRPRKGVKAESAGEILRSALAGDKPNIPPAVYVDDLAVADALAPLFDVIVEGAR